MGVRDGETGGLAAAGLMVIDPPGGGGMHHPPIFSFNEMKEQWRPSQAAKNFPSSDAPSVAAKKFPSNEVYLWKKKTSLEKKHIHTVKYVYYK